MSTSTYLRPSQRVALQQDLQAAESALNNPEIAPYIEDKTRARQQARDLKKTLDEKSPKPYETPQAKDAAMARERELREQWSTGMLSQEEMRRNRQGTSNSVYRHMKWEQANKKKIQEWKEIRARLEPDSDDPDLCNIEQYRPSQAFVMDTTAQIAGHHAMSSQAKANWPLGDPKAETAVAHLEKKAGK